MVYVVGKFFDVRPGELVQVVHGKFLDVLIKIGIVVMQVAKEDIQPLQVCKVRPRGNRPLGRDQVPCHEPWHGLKQFLAFLHGNIVLGLFVFK
jgi:hypothetical protein